MDQPLPIVLYKKFTNTDKSPFRWGLVKAKRGGNSWRVFPISRFVESDLTTDLLNESPVFSRRFYAWVPENTGHLKVLEEAFDFSGRANMLA